MPRLRLPAVARAFAVAFCGGGVAVSAAGAQTADGDDFRPALDGTRDAAKFRPVDRSPVGDTGQFKPQTFGNPPASGAGVTGFDSTNARKKKPPAKPGAAPSATSIPPAAAPKGYGAKPVPKAPPPPPADALPSARIPVPVAGVAHLPPQLARRGAPTVPDGSVLALPPNIVPPRSRSLVPIDPYAPLGIHAGTFYVKPALEVTGGYDSNPTRISAKGGSPILLVSPELHAESDWLRHSLTADLKGTYTAYGRTFGPAVENGPAGPVISGTPESLDRPSLDARLRGRLDIDRENRFDGEGRVLVGTDNPGTPNVQAGLKRLPIVVTTGTTLGYTHAINRLDLTGKVTLDRAMYQDSALSDGTSYPNIDRNYDQVGYALRAGYEVSPALKPFIEGGVDSRVHDLAVDRNGFRRDSNGQYIQVGSTFELTRKLTGVASVGYLEREYKDPLLLNPKGVTFDGALIWTATALTTATLTAKSAVAESIAANISGTLSRDVNLKIDHAFRLWLLATLNFGYGQDNYVGSTRVDDRFTASATLTYKMNRNVWLKGELRQDWLKSNIPGTDYQATTALVGVRLQD